ncbi:conserved hypothetical protein [Microbacterium sp. C448]|uniref:DUF4190 domain-containing protein n=1 Tax=Microbacterium TaxID=33882 RepID=UPI0003DE33EC|nr:MULTISPECIES: DUF4190 domain-containing protein [Microbacterium]CDK00806.1 conserved hypothetical protein [Microbacterium sp. C448]
MTSTPPSGDPGNYPPAPPVSQGYPAAPPTNGYPAAPGYGAYAPAAKTNTLAIVSLISAIVGFVLIPFVPSIVAVITGHMSLGQIKRTGEQGRGLGLAGTIIGWVGVGLWVLALIALLAFLPFFITMVENSPSSYS